MRIPSILMLVAGFALGTVSSLSRDAVAASPGDVLCVHDVRDLIAGDLTLDDLVTRVRNEAGEGASITPLPDRGQLIVTAPTEVQNRLIALLRTLRDRMSRLVTVQTRILRTERHLVAPGGGPWVLDSAKVARLIESLGLGAQVMVAPSITCHDGQRADVSMLGQMSCVTDYDIELTRTGAIVADPVVQTLEEGLRLSVKPVVSRDREFTTLLVQVDMLSLKRPIETVRVRLDADLEVSVQLPEQTHRTWRAAVTLPAGSTAILDMGPSEESGGQRLALMLTATPLDDAETEAIRPAAK